MKFQQLETFFWAAKLGSFAAAASRLHATQSTVSMRIRELESTLGISLFDRSKRNVRLTEKGRELVEYATQMLELKSTILYRMASPETITGSLRLGVAEVVSMTWLPELINEISAVYPGIRLEIEEALTADLMRELRDGNLELVLVPGHTPDMNLRTRTLGQVEFAWLASPRLELNGVRHTAQSLAHFPIIGLKNASYHYAHIENWFRQANVRCRYFARCKSVGVAAAMAAAGVGIAYLPLRCYAGMISEGQLVALETTQGSRMVEFVAAYPVDEFDPIATRIAELAASVSDFQTSRPPQCGAT